MLTKEQWEQRLKERTKKWVYENHRSNKPKPVISADEPDLDTLIKELEVQLLVDVQEETPVDQLNLGIPFERPTYIP